MIKINLVSEGRKPVVARKSAEPGGPGMMSDLGGNLGNILLVGGLIAALGAFGLWWWMKNSEVNRNQAEIATAEARVRELEEFIRKVEEAEAKEAELNRKIEVITNLKNNQRGPVEIMDEISRALPELLWLDRLDQTGSTVTLTGRAFNNNALSAFIKNLDNVPVFSEPTLRDSSRRPNGQVYTFTLFFSKMVLQPESEGDDIAGEPAGG